MAQTQIVLELNGRTITLVGTAHISEESIAEVSKAIKERGPDCVAIELDERRCNSIKNPNSWKDLDIVKVLRRKEGFLLLANLVLASMQKRMGQNVGARPGDEMIAAMRTAEELCIPSVLVDRPIQITLRRAWSKSSPWGKCKLLSEMLVSAFSSESVSLEEIEALKNRSEMDSLMAGLSEYLPAVKEVLIDERDMYLASHIWNAEGGNIVAVLGAGHLPGVKAHLEKISRGEESTDTERISCVSERKVGAKIAAWTIPAIIVLLIFAGFYFGGGNVGKTLAASWFLWNGSLAALGALAAAAHPLAILVSFVGAPFTSLCPFIGIGILSGIVQALLCRPKVRDMESLMDDASSAKGFYRNRILRVLLVFLLSSLGSSAGTFIAGADIISKIAGMFRTPA